MPRAKRADFAANAGKLNGHSSAVNPKRGQIPVVGANGKLSPALGAVGPAGPTGPAGPQGPQGTAGVAGYQRVSENVTVPENSEREFGVSCPGGRSVFGGGWFYDEDFVDRAVRVRVASRLRLGLALPGQQRDAREQADDPVRGLRERGR